MNLGLRGAMAFALASQSVVDLPKDYGRIYLTSTLFTIFFTVSDYFKHKMCYMVNKTLKYIYSFINYFYKS